MLQQVQRTVRTQNVRTSDQIPINKIGSDARELNCQELVKFQSILNERKHGPVPCAHRDMECVFQHMNNSTSRNNVEFDDIYEVPDVLL